MNQEIKNDIDNFIDEFKNLDVVKKYLELKKALLQNDEFKNIKDRKKKAQKKVALSITNHTEHEKAKNEFEQVCKEYNEFPLYVNYLEYEEEVHHLLKNIEDTIS